MTDIVSAAEYLYYGRNCVLDELSYSHNSGCKMKIALEDPEDVSPFGSMTRRSKNQAGQILKVALRRPGERQFEMVEAWFAGWSVSHSKGATIALTIEVETFERLRALDEKQQLEIVVYQIENDGTSHNEQVRSAVEAKLKGGPMSVQAGKACGEISFHRYLEKELEIEIGTAKEAADAVRAYCKIPSRARLDHDEQAKAAWQRLYRGYLGTLA